MAIDLLKYMIWKNGTGGGGASYEKTVGPAPIISISDAKAKPAKSLVVGMEPIQDLHGYDSPWPAGGGKNKLNTTMTTVTRSGVTFTPNNDGTITASGTSINSISDITFANNIDVLPNTNYILTGCPSGGSSSTYRLNLLINGSQAVLDYGSGAAFTTPEQITSLRVYPIVLAGVDMNGKVYQPMIRLATETDATFAPYSNICPISGRTGVTVERTGKNLIDDSKCHVANNTTVYVGAKSDAYTVALSAGTYTISVDFSNEPYGMYYREANDTYNRNIWTSGGNVTQRSFTIDEDGVFRFWVYRNENSGGVDPTKIIHVQLELGSTDTEYEPYVGASYPITWQSEAGTVYCGTVDIVSGVLTVRNIGIAFDGTEDWKSPVDAGYFLYIINASTSYGVSNTGICSHLPLATNISESNSVTGFRLYGRSPSPSGFVVIMRFDPTKQQTLTEFKNYLSTQDTAGTPVIVVYELSEPQTYQLTPTQIQLLKGSNTLWSNADDLTLTYLGTNPPNLLGGMLGGMLGNPQEPAEEFSEESEAEPVSEEPQE